jgi:serine protease
LSGKQVRRELGAARPVFCWLRPGNCLPEDNQAHLHAGLNLKQLFTHRLGVAAAFLLVALPPQQVLAASAQPPADAVAMVGANSDAAQVSRLVVRLRPEARPAEGNPISAATLAALESYLGQRLSGASVTAAGNQVIELATPVSAATATQLANALRLRGDVVWAEVERGTGTRPIAVKAMATSGSNAPTVRRLIVTFADAELAQASRRNAKLGVDQDAVLSKAAGTALHVARATVGGAWLVEFPAAVDMATAEATAAKLESAGIVRFAAPDYPVRMKFIPNDPFFAQDQWNLQDVASTGRFGINATHAWDITTGSPSMVIAVVDTGTVPHPDLAGRILPGYDFVSDTLSANDGDGRDADATDPGDWRTFRLCEPPADDAADSSWHGTLVTGVLAANANNGVGIAGIDWNAQILPVRVLGRCGGDFSDILDGMTWAAGLPVPGVPANPHPAKVINLSLGGEGSCTSQIQSIVDEVLDHGVFIAAAAGNENADSEGSIPASCAGLSTVAATDYTGARASYSNFSSHMDIAAPGGNISRNGQLDAITSTWNDGTTVAETFDYGYADGTSFSTPHVAGVAALMLAVNPALSPAQLKALMAQTASPFAAGSDCVTQGICGAGIVNAFGAVEAAQATLGTPPKAQAVEFYNRSQDHYFLTASAREITDLDNNVFVGWQRTGYVFNTYLAAEPGFDPVCRFYIPPLYGDSHFYTASAVECAIAQAKYPFFVYESPNVFYAALPNTATGVCPAGTIPIYRVWDNRVDTNHRYMTSAAVRASMVAAGWVAEGYGPDQVIMCAPN